MKSAMSTEDYHYTAFGLNIRSPIFFPELCLASTPIQKPDVTIDYAENLDNGLDAPSAIHPYWQAKENSFWLKIKDVATFLISDGCHIRIQPEQNIDLASVRLFVLGSCMGALLMQRDYFVLHGNAIQIGDACISIVGDSGAGKSTLCGAFFKKGYPILADDVCAIDATLKVYPSFPQIKLWQDSATHLSIDTEHLRRVRPKIDKFAIPLREQYQTQALPIRAIYFLTASDHAYQKEDILGLKKLDILYQNIYRKHYLKGLNKLMHHHRQSSQIAKHVSLVSLSRPKRTIEVSCLVDLIEHDLKEKGLQ